MWPYGIIARYVAIGLSAWYVFATTASFWSKVVVTGLLALSFWWRFGFLLQFAIAMYVLLYRTYHKSRV